MQLWECVDLGVSGLYGYAFYYDLFTYSFAILLSLCFQLLISQLLLPSHSIEEVSYFFSLCLTVPISNSCLCMLRSYRSTIH